MRRPRHTTKGGERGRHQAPRTRAARRKANRCPRDRLAAGCPSQTAGDMRLATSGAWRCRSTSARRERRPRGILTTAAEKQGLSEYATTTLSPVDPSQGASPPPPLPVAAAPPSLPAPPVPRRECGRLAGQRPLAAAPEKSCWCLQSSWWW